MNVPEALHALGVRDDTLTVREKAQLDTMGYLPMPGTLSAAEIANIRAAMHGVYAKEKTGREGGPAESSYMQNKAPGFDLCLQKPRVLAAMAHVLDGHIKSFGVHGRPHPPGGERQNLHVDYNGPAPMESRYAVANSLWMLVDFTEKKDWPVRLRAVKTIANGIHVFGLSVSPCNNVPTWRRVASRWTSLHSARNWNSYTRNWETRFAVS